MKSTGSGVRAAVFFLLAGLGSFVWSQSVEALMGTGQDLLQNGAYDQAATKFRQVLSQDPNHFEAQHNLAFAYLQMRRYSDAVREFKKAIGLNGRNPETWANIAVAYESLGKRSEAVDALNRSVELNPGNIPSRMNLATMYVNDGQHARAIAQYKQVIAMDAHQVEAYVNLARCYVSTGNIAEARKALQQAVTNEPQNAAAHYELGSIYWKKDNDTEKALKEFRLAVSLEKNSQEFYENLGLLLQELGKKDEALEVWRTYMIYLDDALRKEKIQKRIDKLEIGDKPEEQAGAGSAAPAVDRDEQTKQLRQDLRAGEGRRESQVMQTTPVDITGDLEDLQKDSGKKMDLKEEAKKKAKK